MGFDTAEVGGWGVMEGNSNLFSSYFLRVIVTVGLFMLLPFLRL